MSRLSHVFAQAEWGGESVPRCRLHAECQVSDRFRAIKRMSKPCRKAVFPQTGTVGVLNSDYNGSMDKMIRGPDPR